MTAAFERWTGWTPADPAFLALALLVPLALWLRARRGEPALPFAPAALLARDAAARLPGTWRTRLLPLPRVAQALGLVLLTVALARPVERVPLPLTTDGIDVLLCLDASSSMSARDLDQDRTRLDVALDAAARFVAGRPSDRVGLVRFARYPDVVCPLTLDHDALAAFLGQVRLVASDGPEDATGIGAAVARAAQLFDPGSAASKVIVLLTDGEETVATPGAEDEIATVHAAQLCERLGVRVYTIAAGVGRVGPGGVRTPLDTGEVERLARRTGGRFFAASDAQALSRVYAEIDALERAPMDEPRYRVEERFLSLLGAAVLLFLLGRVLDASVLAVAP